MNLVISHRPRTYGGTRVTLELDTDISDPGALERLCKKLTMAAGRTLEDFERGDRIGRRMELYEAHFKG